MEELDHGHSWPIGSVSDDLMCSSSSRWWRWNWGQLFALLPEQLSGLYTKGAEVLRGLKMLGESIAGLHRSNPPNLVGRDSRSLSSDEQGGQPVRARMNF